MIAGGSCLYEKPEQFPAPANRPSTSVPLRPVEEVTILYAESEMIITARSSNCLLYTYDAADEL